MENHETRKRQILRSQTAKRFLGRGIIGSIRIPLESLAKAQCYPDALVILDGEFGAISYLTSPARHIRCSIETLNQLLCDLDNLIVAMPAGANVRCERHLSWGAGWWDDWLLDGPVINPVFEPLQVDDDIIAVLTGGIPRLPCSNETLLLQAKAAVPNASRWPMRLAMFYKTQAEAACDPDRPALAAKAVAEFEAAIRLIGRLAERWFCDIAELAFQAGDAPRAEAYAQRALSVAWRSVASSRYVHAYGELIHRADIVLGKLALRSGEVHRAAHYLLSAGKAPWSIASSGKQPDMSLAAMLISHG